MDHPGAVGGESAGGAPVAAAFSWQELVLVAVLIAIIIISIVGNCLVCVAILTDRRLRKLGNAFIVSLAIADLFVSCLVMTFALCNDLMNEWIFGDWFCDVWISFDIMCCTASILNLCAISLDRFIHIKDCLLYNQWMTRRVAFGAVLIIWFISALVSFVPINLGWHRPDYFTSSNRSLTWDSQLRSSPGSSPEQQSDQAIVRRAAPSPTTQIYRQTIQAPQLPLAGKLDYPNEALNLAKRPPIENQSSSPPTSTWGGGRDQLDKHAAGREAQADSVTSRSNSSNKTTPSPSGNSSGGLEWSWKRRRQRNTQRQHNGAPPDTAAGEQFNQVESNSQDGSTIRPALLLAENARNHKLRPRVALAPLQPQDTADDDDSNTAKIAPNWPTMGPRGERRPANLTASGRTLASGAGVGQCMLTLTPTYAIISSTISFYIPCIVMLGLYTKLFACARKHVRSIQAISKAPVPIEPLAVAADQSSGRCSSELADGRYSCQPAASPVNTPAPIIGRPRTWIKFGRRERPGHKQAGHPAMIEEQRTSRQQQQLNGSTSVPQPADRALDVLLDGSASVGRNVVQLSSERQRASTLAKAPEECESLLASSDKRQVAAATTNADGCRRSNQLSRQATGQSERSTGSCSLATNTSKLKPKTAQQQQQQQQSGQLATHKAAVTLGIIMGTFLFCWVPFFCLNITKAFCVDCIPSSIFRAFTWLGYANSALNPIIYGIHNSEFRNAFNRIFFKHLNIKSSRHYLNRRFSYDLRHHNTSTTTNRAGQAGARGINSIRGPGGNGRKPNDKLPSIDTSNR